MVFTQHLFSTITGPQGPVVMVFIHTPMIRVYHTVLMHDIQFFADEGIVLSPLERAFYKGERMPISCAQKEKFLSQYSQNDLDKALGVRLRTNKATAMAELEDSYGKAGGIALGLDFNEEFLAPFVNLKSLPPVVYGPAYISLGSSLREIAVSRSAQKHFERISFNFRKYGVPILQQLF